MTRRGTLPLATIAFLLLAGTAHAQRASIAVGAAMPVGDFSNSATTGFDVQLQFRTEPLYQALALRIDIGYDRLSGKDATASTTISTESVSVIGDLGSIFYAMVGPGSYQANQTTQISGHNVNDQRQYLGAQAALGMNIPVFRWEGFLEVAGVNSSRPAPHGCTCRFASAFASDQRCLRRNSGVHC